MYSNYARIQAIFGQLSTFGSILCLLIALTSFLQPISLRKEQPEVRLGNLAVTRGRAPGYGGSGRATEYVGIKFDLDADLSSLFEDWNTKQVMLYLQADYGPLARSSGKNKWTNEVVLWDRIVTRRSKKYKLHLTNAVGKYRTNDITGEFLRRNGTLALHWAVQPYVGFLRYSKQATPTNFTFPPLIRHA